MRTAMDETWNPETNKWEPIETGLHPQGEYPEGIYNPDGTVRHYD
jgi:hypothetical protein